MKRTKMPVIVIGAGLLLLILVPIFLLIIPEMRRSGDAPWGSAPHLSAEGGAGSTRPVAGESPLDVLAREARDLVSNKMVTAATRKVLPLEALQRFQNELNRADDARSRGREAQARERYESILRDGIRVLDGFEAAERWTERSGAVGDRLESASALVGNDAGLESLLANARTDFGEAHSAASSGNFAGAARLLENVENLLDELDERRVQRVEALVLRARLALEQFDLQTAIGALQEAQMLDPERAEIEDLRAVAAGLQGIEHAVREVDQALRRGDLQEAGQKLEPLLRQSPQNPILLGFAENLRRLEIGEKVNAFLAMADLAERENRLDDAIAALGAALDLREDEALFVRLGTLVEQRERQKLERLLVAGFGALQAANYREARNIYTEAIALSPDSMEAKQGLERAARLLIAEIEFRENLESAYRLAGEGRFPLAATFFNRAMATRPSNLPEPARERQLRELLERQSQRVTVTLRSDGRTFVSMIGVFPPEQFRTKELQLFPDVYRVRGTRRGSEDVEMELKVNAETGAVELTVVAGSR